MVNDVSKSLQNAISSVDPPHLIWFQFNKDLHLARASFLPRGDSPYAAILSTPRQFQFVGSDDCSPLSTSGFYQYGKHVSGMYCVF